MAKQAKLKANVRTNVGTAAAKKNRQQGLVPAVVYAKGEPSVPVTLNASEITNLLSHATSEHFLVELEIAGGEKAENRLALIQEVQHHPLRRTVVHVDFHAVKDDEKIHAEIPIEATGEAIGVKTYGGLLEVAMHSVMVECLPKDLPEVIVVDVSELGLGQSIHVKDLALPAGVTAKADPDLTVMVVAAPRVDTGAAEAAAAAAAPEVIKEKKEEGEKK